MKFDTIWKIEKKTVFCSDLMTPVQFNRLFKYIYQMIINQYTCIKRSQWKFNTWVVNTWIFLQQALALLQLPNIKKIQIHINVYQLYCRINILFFRVYGDISVTKCFPTLHFTHYSIYQYCSPYLLVYNIWFYL